MAKRLFLLDGMALIYRAHFALIRSPIMTTDGTNASALFGFTNTVLELLKKQEPTHLALVFDTSAPTFRHERFPDYKANRDAMPEDLSIAIPHVKRMCEAFNIPVITLDGYEADDIIGTLATQADAVGDFETFMVTPDKDFAQLVSPQTKIYKPGRGGSPPEILGVEEICENWGIERPDQVIDILGLWGDSSDNIPGVPGVGEKTAKLLVAQFGSVEGVLENLEELKGKRKENLTNHADDARLSKELATIIRDVPLDLEPNDLALQERNDEAVKAMLTEFEFNGLGKRLFGKDYVAGSTARSRSAVAGEVEGNGSPDEDAATGPEGFTGPAKTSADVPHTYHALDTDKDRAAFLKVLTMQKSFCFDVETTDLDPKDSRLLGIAFSWEKHTGYYYTVPADPEEAGAVLDPLRPIFADKSIEKVGHNLKFDLAVLHVAGIVVAGPFFDTMLAHSLLEPGQRHGMDKLSETYLHYAPISIKTLLAPEDKTEMQGELALDGDATPGGLEEAPLEQLTEYAAEDADVTWQLAEIFRPLITEAKLDRVFHEIEAPLVQVLATMELQGVRVDCEVLGKFGEVLAEQIEEQRGRIFEAAGQEFNLNSPKQLGLILFDEMKLVDKPKKTVKTGQYVTNEQVLSQLAVEHQIAADILEYREASKLKSTYVDALPNAVHEKTGRIHTNFNQLVTDTGRLASSGPNLQNIPVRTAQGREIRRAFVPRDEGHQLVAADYSQVELRIMASVSGDEGMRAAFADDLDIHTATAARVYGVEFLEDVLPEQRRRAKMVNFGIIYGISAFGLSQRLRIPRKEAAEIIEEYFKNYQGVKTYMEKTVVDAQESGFVETLTGRRRYLRDINSQNGTVRGRAEREAINTPIQGSAADMIKIAMARVDAALREGGFKSRLVLQVHDELVLDCPKEEVESVTELLVEHMRDALPLDSVPVVVDTGVGEHWLEAH